MKRSITVYLGVGSNQGDRFEHCREAILRLQESGTVRPIRVSSAYETEPVGEGLEGWFINVVVEGETGLDPLSLLGNLKRIEKEMGRQEVGTQRDRPIDLDLLLYGDLLLESDRLTLPHPRLHERRFVLEPLSELVPQLIHPRFGRTMEALLSDLADPHQVKRLDESLQGST
jgi:2-amino-4-hydroxy-6-hydroxymethyldihydropteridine diphosphokinase